MKRFFARHSKSSALAVTLAIHGALLIVAMGFVAFRVLIPLEVTFEGTPVERKKPRLPLNMKPFKTPREKPKPQITKRPPKITSIKPSVVEVPQVAMIGIPTIGNGDDTAPGLEIDLDTTFRFFDSEAKGEKVCFIVHFGPATIGKNPYSRMTGYTIRKRLEEYVQALPDYTLFNVACYWANDTCAMAPKMMTANAANKQSVMDWMEPVNPLEGEYDHCFVWKNAGKRIQSARRQWPTRVEKLPFYSPKWVYPYVVPKDAENKYLGNAGYMHWGRGVAWAALTQKPDTIFVLTTNYIDGWGSGGKGNPGKMVEGYEQLFRDIYGPDKKIWPTLNVVVLSHAGRDSSGAHNVLNAQFGPLVKAFKGDGSVIENIAKFMTAEEKTLLRKYASEYGN